MNLLKALLLSSKRQALAGEYEKYPDPSLFSSVGRRIVYIYLVTDGTDNTHVFEVYRVLRELYQDEHGQEHKRVGRAEHPHVLKEFADVDGLLAFLRQQQINVEDGWEPVEDADKA